MHLRILLLTLFLLLVPHHSFAVEPEHASRALSNTTSSTKHIYGNGTLLATIERPGGALTPKVTYLHGDHLGRTNVTSNETPGIVQVIDYYPYGEVRFNNQYGTSQEKNTYIGQEYDTASSLSYLNARYYDGRRGQFMSQDPVFWEIGQTQDGKTILANPQLQNSYSYAGNNPVNGKDPEGRIVEYDRLNQVCHTNTGIILPHATFPLY